MNSEATLAGRPALPAGHEAFLKRALPVLQKDDRLVGVAAGGSFVTGEVDEYFDLDLVLVGRPESCRELLTGAKGLAAALGPLLAAFTGEHVGEPRLLICLYGPPLLHVDLKVVSAEELDDRVEDPVVLWERDGAVSGALGRSAARYPEPDAQWIEDRFWVWVHYVGAKIGRGELFEAIGALAFLREKVLGPMVLLDAGQRPAGVRRLEARAPDRLDALRGTIAAHDARACVEATSAAVALYRELRETTAPPDLARRERAEAEACAYLEEVIHAG